MPASSTVALRRTAASRFLFLALAAFAAAAIGAPVAGAADAKYEGISTDGEVAIFSTFDRLVPGDTDNRRDVYERSFNLSVGDYVTRQTSLGPIGGNDAFDASFYGVDPTGAIVLFSTTERMTPDDTDTEVDIYLRDLVDNTTARVSRGAASCEPGCGNGADASSPVPGGFRADGDVAFFATQESLSPADGDASLDLYARDLTTGTTALVSRGDAGCEPSGCGRGAIPAFFQGDSAGGEKKAYFTTTEGLVAADNDGLGDIYERDLDAGTTRLISVEGTCPGSLPPGQNCDPTFGGVSPDGSHVFFETNDRVSAGDTDSSQDVYDWSDGVVARASIGPNGGNDAVNALFAGSSADGETVFFATGERLDPSVDTDGAQDVYARVAGATTELVSAGEASCQGSGCGNGNLPASLRWVPPSGAATEVILSTAESLAGADGDSSQDVYARDLVAGTTTLVSRADPSCVASDCGDGAFDANFARVSADGSSVFFVSDESLTAVDTDARTDIYKRSGGATSLVSTGSINGNGPFDAQLHGVSADGSFAFFLTNERLAVDDDFLAESDVYVNSSDPTRLVSVDNDPTLLLGPPAPTLQRTNPVSPNPSTLPAIVGQAAASALVKIYTNSDCTGEIVATGTAEQLAAPGISVEREVATGSTTGYWATAEAEGVTSPCSSGISYTQQSETPPPPPPPPPPPAGDPGDGSGSGGGAGTGGSTGALPRFYDGGIPFVTPKTRITFGPAFKTRRRRAVFRFFDSTGQPGTRFKCRLDRRRWRSCRSPKRFKRLGRRRHVFKVKAVNAAGAWQRRAVRRKFKVVR